jgi:hypothetical protein
LDKDGRNILFDAMCDSQGRSKFRFFDTEILVGKVGGGRGNVIKQHDQRAAGLMLLELEPDKVGSLCSDSSYGGRMLEYDELVAYICLSDALGTRLEKPNFLAAKNGINWDAKILVKNHNLGSIRPWEPKLSKARGQAYTKCFNQGQFCSHQSKGSAILEQLGYKTTVSATQFLTL